jgi:hypothetical protein
MTEYFPEGWTEAQFHLAQKLYQEGLSLRLIGIQVGKTGDIVKGVAHRAGWPRRVPPVCPAGKARGYDALPPGHPLTWGVISNESFPTRRIFA